MNRKGQALVEFVLILPVFLMILFIIVDFGVILNNKSRLENDSADIIDLYKNGSTIEEIKTIYKDTEITKEDYKTKYIKITIKKDINLITPGLERILEDPFPITIERIISAT